MNQKNRKKVFVGMSGGVDSSVAAALLKKKGYEVTGIHLKCWSGGPSTGLRATSCSAEQDVEDARKAAEVLGIPFYIFDFEKEYKDKVVKYMVDGYRKGITPNPDVMCNKEIKFGLFLDRALKMGADYVATGHYVRLCRNGKFRISNFEFDSKLKIKNSKFSLWQARDKNKDQSYFLWTLTQDQLKHCLFPIGDYVKSEVRKIAKKYNLPNADKKDSQGICFLGQVSLKDFLKDYIKEKEGKVLDTSGKVVGKHKGAYFYTIGQRRLKIDQRPTTNDQRPLYVAEKDIKTNTILVAEKNNPELFKKEIKLKNVNLLNQESGIRNQGVKIPVMARVRYRQPLFPALFIIHNSSFKLVFDKKQKFIASGQSAVFYLPAAASAKGGGLEMLGGGVVI